MRVPLIGRDGPDTRSGWDADDYLAKGTGLTVLGVIILGGAIDSNSSDWAFVGAIVSWAAAVLVLIGIVAKGIEVSRRVSRNI